MSLTSKQIEELRAYAADRKGELAKLINDAADTIELLSIKLRASQPEQRWIPVSERLPDDVEIGEEYPTVIFCTAEGTVHVGGYEHYLGGKWWYMETWEDEAKGVIAWMPLPEPWRGEEDDTHAE